MINEPIVERTEGAIPPTVTDRPAAAEGRFVQVYVDRSAEDGRRAVVGVPDHVLAVVEPLLRG